MKKLVLITVLSLLTVLHIKAQYSKLTLGQRCPFDTAVAVQIKTYRLESLKFQKGDSLISILKSRIQVSDSISADLKIRLMYSQSLVGLKNEELAVKIQTIETLKKELQYKPKTTWWDRNQKYVYFAAGFVTSGAVIHFATK